MTESTAEPRCWWLYVVETAAGALYTGISTDVERRFREHRHGRRGARALRGKGPLRLVHCQRVGDHGDALRLEAWLKRQSAPAKRAWLATRGGEAASPPQSAAASAAKTRATASAPGTTTPSSDSAGT